MDFRRTIIIGWVCNGLEEPKIIWTLEMYLYEALNRKISNYWSSLEVDFKIQPQKRCELILGGRRAERPPFLFTSYLGF